MEKKTTPIAKVDDLVIHYETRDGVVEAVNGVSFEILPADTFGLVGETGAGKTTIALAMMGLLPYPPTHIIRGKVEIDGEDIAKKSKNDMRAIRGKKVSMIFQDPMTALNPVVGIGDQIAEVILLHERCTKEEAQKKALDMLQMVGIRPERYKDYPHQLSGGMKQRVVIAIALACNPELLIADEPTTALDVTIQAQVLDMIKDLRDRFGTALMLITHDLGIVADICNKCAVVYAGEIVEIGTVEDIFDRPQHPYTLGLFASIPSLDKDVERLQPVKGQIIDPTDLPPYCSFCDRCDRCTEQCRAADPKLVEVSPGHFVKCIFARKEAD
ncbi:MAG: ABC transporter ATP-binding protein [Clostridia bacterium]|nr:ABC transporter ATP-binding protein [Clostridia bacterium]